jgi:protein-glutamine gamma-glutamyltransferase
VLTLFDGREWWALAPTTSVTPAELDLNVRGRALRYEVTLEPQRLSLLPLLEASVTAPIIDNHRVVLREGMQWRTDRPLLERLRFDVEAFTDFRLGAAATPAALRESLALPRGHNPRTLAWAAALRSEPRMAGASAGTLAAAVLSHISTGGYTYTLTPGLYGEADLKATIDEFWLDRKLGFCEHFAAAFVVIMRAMDVPARVVTGYQGTDPLPVDGFHIVRQSYAHAWAEYWQEGVGWVRADPTQAVAPDRILRSRSLSPAPGLVAGALGTMSPALMAQLRSAWEATNNRWNQWVLSYARGQQLELLRNLGFVAPSWEDLSLLLIGILSSLALAAAGWAWWDRRRVDPWVRQMDSVRQALRALDVDAAPHEPARTMAQRVRERLGTAGDALVEMLHTIDRQRYSRLAIRRPDSTLTRRFRATARALRRNRSAIPAV